METVILFGNTLGQFAVVQNCEQQQNAWVLS